MCANAGKGGKERTVETKMKEAEEEEEKENKRKG